MKKRLAVCFWGQTRTFRIVYELNKLLWERTKEEFDVDFYIHTWTTNTGGLGEDTFREVDTQRLQKDLEDRFKPVSCIIEDLHDVRKSWRSLEDRSDRIFGYLYSLSKVLGNCIQSGVEYDRILVFRMDMWFSDTKSFKERVELIQEDREVGTVSGVFPENFRAEHDYRVPVCVRDEAYLLTLNGARDFQNIFHYWVGHTEPVGRFRYSELESEMNVPETVIARFFVECKKVVRDIQIDGRVIVREPVEEFFTEDSKELRQALLEVRAYVDWCTKRIDIFREFYKNRAEGLGLRETLQELDRILEKEGLPPQHEQLLQCGFWEPVEETLRRSYE